MEAKSLESHVMYPYSYAYGKSSKTLLYESLARCLEKVAAKHNKIAVISEHENVMKTFQELNADANRLAKVMAQKLHIKLGDVVAVMTANCYNFVVIQYACAKIGAILCPINAYYTSQELEMCLKKVNPKLFFIPSKGSDQELSVNKIYDVFVDIKTELPSKLSHVIFLDGNGSSCGPLKNCASHYFSDLVYGEDKICADELNNNVFVDIDADEVCSFFFTSGTTGSPKAAILSHFNLTNNTRFFGERLDFAAGNNVIVCLPVPVFHVFGAVLGTITMATTGVTIVMTGYRYSVESVVHAIIKHKCTHFMGVPAMLIDIMNYIEDNNLQITTLVGVITAATTVPYEVVQRFATLVPTISRIDIVYGATECSPIVTSPLPQTKIEDALDNVGVPLDFVEVKLVDRDTGKIVKIGEKGELWTRGPHVFVGYWNDVEQTKKAINSGRWYNTGDLATMDQNGCCRIVGRTKEIIIRGGINIYPREIEEVLITHPLVKNAAVCGVPDPRLGEEVCAWITLRDPSATVKVDALREFCKGKLAYFKIPRKILIVDEFPMTKSGKVQKFKMSEMSIKLLMDRNKSEI